MKMVHVERNGSQLRKWFAFGEGVTLNKMGHFWANGS